MFRTYLLAVFFWFFMLLVCLFLIPLGILNLLRLRKAEERLMIFAAGFWARTLFWAAGRKIEIRGKDKIPEHNRICFVGNHQSYADIPLIIGMMGKRVGFIAKKELGKVPLLNAWIKAFHCILIDRGQGRQSLKMIEKGMEQIYEGYPLVLFPEGTRAKNGVMKHFKSGGIQMAVRQDITIVPVTIDGMFRAYEEHLRVMPGKTIVTIHDPIDTAGMSREERKELTPRLEQIVQSALPEAYRIREA